MNRSRIVEEKNCDSFVNQSPPHLHSTPLREASLSVSQQGLTWRTDQLLDLGISDPVAPAQVQQPQTGQGGRDQGRQTGPGQTRHPQLPQTWTDGQTGQRLLLGLHENENHTVLFFALTALPQFYYSMDSS